jgi:AcrR family transcriptional regulator
MENPGLEHRLTESEGAPPEAAAPSRTERKLAQVLAGAREVILAHGFQAASVDDIARAAGVSKATLYRYFPDKASLFAAVMSADCIWRCEERLPVETEGRPLAEILSDVALWHARKALSPEGQSAFRAALAESERFPELGVAFFDKMDGGRRSLVPILAQAAERGEIETDDPDQAARHFFALCRGDLFLRRLFCGAEACCDDRMQAHVREAVRAFLQIYRPAS